MLSKKIKNQKEKIIIKTTLLVFFRAIFRFSFCRPEYKTFSKVFSGTFLVNLNSINSTNASKDLTTRLTEFYHLWPLEQWISSLITLILLYWITGYYYNKWLSHKGGWLDWKMRIWLIISDLTINLMLGLYYMNHRETVFGIMMLRCPIAISPLIFILELACFYMYYRFGKSKIFPVQQAKKKIDKKIPKS